MSIPSHSGMFKKAIYIKQHFLCTSALHMHAFLLHELYCLIHADLSTLSLYTLIAEIRLHTQLQRYIANAVLGLFDQEEVVCCCFAQAGFVISLSPILYKQLEPI